MDIYLLDTNICIYIAKNNPPKVRERFARYQATQLAMSVITLGELRAGAEKSQHKKQAIAKLAILENLIPVYEMPIEAAEHYGHIRSSLEKKGQPIGNNDLWIAAHALSKNWILVTNNEREFKRIKGLPVENWIN